MLVTLTLFSERETSRPGGKHVTKHDISVTLTESLKWDINVKNTLQVVKFVIHAFHGCRTTPAPSSPLSQSAAKGD